MNVDVIVRVQTTYPAKVFRNGSKEITKVENFKAIEPPRDS